MITRILKITVFSLMALSVQAQPDGRRGSGDGYFFFAPGVHTAGGWTESIMQTGGGAEGIVYKGLGAGIEASYLFPTKGPSYGFFTVAPGVTYQFSPKGRTVPFVTGGYALAFRSEFTGLAHFGAGVMYYVKPRYGLRFEVKDHYHNDSQSHFLVFRFGLAVR